MPYFTTRGQAVRILIVDDDELNVELFEASLLRDGHDVRIERTGVAGEVRALAEPFDLILLDIQLPGRSGIEVCRTLRAAGLRAPIIAVSASVLPAEIAKTKDAGFTDFLAKPIAPAALRAFVRAIVAPESG
jgi:DNA-binding response OmpR family regulator